MFTNLTQQFTAFWSGLKGRQRAVLILGSVTALLAMTVFINWATTPTYEVAFSGLSEADAGQIVESLQSINIPYQLQGSGTILVPSDQVYDARIRLAQQGLPSGGSVGFELFSGSSLGMTEFSQRVNYQQAMEGELERTISSISAIEMARVHIVTPEQSLLAYDDEPATASVTLQVNAGYPLDAGQIRAITHLVASSVEGLLPENVVVVDVNGNLLAAGSAGGAYSSSLSQTDSRRSAEESVASEIQGKVRNLLDTVLGPNQSVVQVSVSLDWNEREINTQTYDPETSVVRSSQETTETYGAGMEETGGVPGAESNLPEGDAETIVTTNEDGAYYYTSEITNYEISQSQSREVIPPGEIERVSLSVLVDGITDAGELETLQTAITAAAGIDAERGDVVAVQSLAFDRSYYDTQVEAMAEAEKSNLIFTIAQYAVPAILIAAVLWYVQRLLSNLRLSSEEAWQPVLKPASELAMAASRAGIAAGGGANLQIPQQATPAASAGSFQEASQAPRRMIRPQQNDADVRTLVDTISREEPAAVADVIHLWLSEDEGNHA